MMKMFIFPLKRKHITTLFLSKFQFSFSCFFSHSLATIPNSNKIPKEQIIHPLFKQCSTQKNLYQIHAYIIKTGFHQNLLITGKLISHCALTLHNSMDYAITVFEQIESPDGFIWNTIIRGIGNSTTKEPKQAFEFYKRMLEHGEKPDNFTYSFLLKICAQLGDSKLGKQLHCSSLKAGFDVTLFVRNTIIHMYGMFKDIQSAHTLFDEIPQPNLVAWNTIMHTYVSCGMCKEALDMFLKMHRIGIQPDVATIVSVISACSELVALDFGEWVYSLVSYIGLDDSVPVCNSLIDMYAKCGEVERACFVFKKMNKRSVVSWNSMILGFAMNGYVDDALGVFEEMMLKREIPDDVTFLGVLCACRQGGLIDKGKLYFASMTRDYGIKPTIKHYGCMVDLLGKAGFVKDAYQLVLSMPMACNAVVWRALLSACRVHGDLELGAESEKASHGIRAIS